MSSPTPSSGRLLGVWRALLASASVLLCIHPVVEPDFFLHTMLGREVLRARSRVVIEPASYIDVGIERPVPQWLWSTTHSLLYDWGGWTLVYAAMALVVAATAVALVSLLSRLRPASPGAVVLISGVTMALTVSRMRLRPQTLAIALLVFAVLLARRFSEVRGSARWLAAGLLLAVEVIWAQVHGSFVLVPMICVAVIWAPALRRREPRDLLEHGLLLALLGAGLLTSVWGVGVVDYVLHHAAGDAKQHISEWAAPTWASFHPLRSTIGPTYAALWLIGIAGMVRARRVWWAELSLALLGLWLFSTALRFGAMGGLLVAPLAVAGAAELGRTLPWKHPARILAMAIALLVLARFGVRIHDRLGPLGRVGMAEGHHPTSVARYLAEQPEGIRVLGDQSVGAPVAYWQDGHALHFVDTRTPLHFDATDYGLARDAWLNGEILERTTRYHGVHVISVARNEPTCPLVGESWVPVVVDARFTTFVRAGEDAPLTTLVPCGGEYVRPDACADGGVAMGHEIERLAAWLDEPFHGFLRAEHAARCLADARRAASDVPPASRAREYPGARTRLLARIDLLEGRTDEALARLAPGIAAGDPADLALAGPALFGGAAPERAIELLQSFAAAKGDATPAAVRADLAWLCTGVGDAECARFHGFRAAAAGHPGAIEPLVWLAQHHPDEGTRAEAERWIALLQRELAPPDTAP